MWIFCLIVHLNEIGMIGKRDYFYLKGCVKYSRLLREENGG